MGIYNNWPYSNIHELNLDWIVRKIEELEKYIKIIQPTEEFLEIVKQLRIDFNSLQNEVEHIDVDFSEVERRLGVLENSINTITGNITTINGRVTTNENSINTINGQINTINGNINTINGNINTLNGRVGSIENTLPNKVDVANPSVSGQVRAGAGSDQSIPNPTRVFIETNPSDKFRLVAHDNNLDLYNATNSSYIWQIKPSDIWYKDSNGLPTPNGGYFGNTVVASNDTQLPSNANSYTNIGEITLTPGVWAIQVGVNYASNNVGFRQFVLANTTTGGSITYLSNWSANAINGIYTVGSLTYLEKVTTTKTFYINARQNSGTALDVNMRAKAICIG